MPHPTQGFTLLLFLIKHFQIREHAHVELHIIFSYCLHSFEFLLYLILSAYYFKYSSSLWISNALIECYKGYTSAVYFPLFKSSKVTVVFLVGVKDTE